MCGCHGTNALMTVGVLVPLTCHRSQLWRTKSRRGGLVLLISQPRHSYLLTGARREGRKWEGMHQHRLPYIDRAQSPGKEEAPKVSPGRSSCPRGAPRCWHFFYFSLLVLWLLPTRKFLLKATPTYSVTRSKWHHFRCLWLVCCDP